MGCSSEAAEAEAAGVSRPVLPVGGRRPHSPGPRSVGTASLRYEAAEHEAPAGLWPEAEEESAHALSSCCFPFIILQVLFFYYTYCCLIQSVIYLSYFQLLDPCKHTWKISLETTGSVGSEKQRFGGDYQP